MNEQQHPISNEQANPALKSDLKYHLTTITPLSKALAMFLFVTLPFVGFWLGTESRDTSNMPIAESEKSHSTPPASQPAPANTAIPGDPESKTLDEQRPPCFNGTPLVAMYDSGTWDTFDGDGFEFKYPADLLYVEEGDANLRTDINGYRQLIITPLGSTTPKVEIDVYTQYQPRYYTTRYLATGITYDWLSETWWTGNGYVNNTYTDAYAECLPNSVAETVEGVPIYSLTDADVGEGFTKYTVILKDITAADGSTHVPQAIEVKTRFSGNSPTETQESEKRMQSLIESILPTIKARGNLKG